MKRTICLVVGAMVLEWLTGWFQAGATACAQSKPLSDVSIRWDFDNGSLSGWRVNESNEVELALSPDAGEIWYHFEINGVEGKQITFVIENARKDFFDGDSLPALSYDPDHWSYIKRRVIRPQPGQADQVRYEFTHTFALDRAWIAYAPPYTNRQLDRLIETIEPHPHTQILDICKTIITQLPLPVIRITDPDAAISGKKNLIFLGREESLESASSWICEGIVRFLLSEDPIAAAIKRRCVVYVVPIFDRDGVALGHAVHPIARGKKSVYWTETWPETSYSFYEQRQIKRFLQELGDREIEIDLSVRIHSGCWGEDHLRAEHSSKDNIPRQTQLCAELLSNKYLPWFRNLDRLLRETRFSKFVHELFPRSVSVLWQSNFIYHRPFGRSHNFLKTYHDLLSEGELVVLALAEWLGVPAANPPPFLHAADHYATTETVRRPFLFSCVYRDLFNRPPTSIQVVVNDKPYDLQPVLEENREPDYFQGVLYHAYVPIEDDLNSHYFIATNESSACRVPSEGARVGPLLLSKSR